MVLRQTGLASPSSVPVSPSSAAQAASFWPGPPAVPGGGHALGTLQTPSPWQAGLPGPRGCWARPASALPGGGARSGTRPEL